MTDEMLLSLVNELSLAHFGLPYVGQARFNARFTRLGGRCTFRRGCGAIEISAKHFTAYGDDFLRATILHELCHYHLFAKGLRHNHRSAAFKDLLTSVGATMHCPALEMPKRRLARRYAYQCPTCGRIFHRVKPIQKPSSCGYCDRRFNPKHILVPLAVEA